MDIRQKIVAEAETWLGTPYHHQADVKGAGTDCAMVLVRVYHSCGLIPDIDPRPYPHDWNLHRDDERYLGWVLQYGREVDEPQIGDTVVYRFGRSFSHGGIYVGDGQIIHAYVGRGVVLSEIDEGELAARQRRHFNITKGLK